MQKNTSELLEQLKIDRNAVPPTRTFTLRTTLAIAIAAVTSGLLLGALANNQFDDSTAAGKSFDSQPQTTPVSTSDSVQPDDLTTPSKVDLVPSSDQQTVLNASGYITARRMATVSAEVMGLITSVEVEEGMQVEQGQILARLDAAVAQVNLDFSRAQVNVLRAQLAGVDANLNEARRQQVRFNGLIDKNFSSRAQLSQTAANVESLQANLASARANIEVAELEVKRQQERFNDHIIRAPFSGVVTQKNAQPGEIVAPSSAGGGFTRTGICTIVDMESLEIEVDVNEAFIGRVSTGQKVSANLDAYPNWDIPATVVAIIPTADRAKATVRVRIGIDEKDSRILPDMGIKVAFLK